MRIRRKVHVAYYGPVNRQFRICRYSNNGFCNGFREQKYSDHCTIHVLCRCKSCSNPMHCHYRRLLEDFVHSLHVVVHRVLVHPARNCNSDQCILLPDGLSYTRFHRKMRPLSLYKNCNIVRLLEKAYSQCKSDQSESSYSLVLHVRRYQFRARLKVCNASCTSLLVFVICIPSHRKMHSLSLHKNCNICYNHHRKYCPVPL